MKRKPQIGERVRINSICGHKGYVGAQAVVIRPTGFTNLGGERVWIELTQYPFTGRIFTVHIRMLDSAFSLLTEE